LDGYNAVFYAAINSNKTLFTSNNEILYSWKMFDPLIKKWKTSSTGLKKYKKYQSFN
jgi:glucose-6-phosphate 1-dehydrogenase